MIMLNKIEGVDQWNLLGQSDKEDAYKKEIMDARGHNWVNGVMKTFQKE